MKMEWHDSVAAWRFCNTDSDKPVCRPEREIWLTNEEAQFIAKALKRQQWRYDIENQIEYDEDNLDFSETSRNEFIDMCLEDIDARIEIYGVDNYEPNIEEIVFDVAQDNDIWRD